MLNVRLHNYSIYPYINRGLKCMYENTKTIVIFSTVEMSFSAKDFVTEEDVCFRFVGSLQ